MKWDLTKIFKTIEEFDELLEKVLLYPKKIKEYKDLLHNFKDFKECYLLQKKFDEDASKLYLYAHLNSDLNKKDVNKAILVQKCMVLINEMMQASSYIEPEVLRLGYDKVMKFLEDEELKEFKFPLTKLFDNQNHVLDNKQEQILSIHSPLYRTGSELYSMLSVADMQPKTITYNNEEKVITQGNWSQLVSNALTENDRFNVFKAIFEYYELHKNTYAKIYDSILDTAKAIKDVRRYNSILESYLDTNNIDTLVYTNLISVARSSSHLVHRYLKLKAKHLNLDEFRTYHRFLKLKNTNKTYTYDEAKELFFNSIEKFPKEFIEYAKMALEDGYVDVLEQSGKRTGAYSSSVANSRPYILLNYDNTLSDVFTVAHEAGHSIHSLYAKDAQPSTLQQYTIFVAEIASTFNEHNLLDYLMSTNSLTKDEKIQLLQKSLDDIVGTFYRQTLFADYELIASKLKEENKPINHEVLSNIMIDLYKTYYDIDITKETYKQYVWAYIPHLFYSPFYVYQYATSFSASFKLYQSVKNNEKDAFTKYTNLLKAGGSKYPMDEAKDAGVDFTKKETFEAVSNRFEELLNTLENLLNE